MREPVTVSPEVTRLIAEGNVLEDIGRLPEALVRYDAAIRIAPGYHRDCAIQTAGRITFAAIETTSPPSPMTMVFSSQASAIARTRRK